MEKKKLEIGKNLEVWKKFGNLGKKFKFANLENILKNGKKIEILKQLRNFKNNFETWKKKLKICRNLGRKIGNIEKNLKIGEKDLEMSKKLRNWEKL